MDEAGIRIQVPGGDAFHDVLAEAAAKVAWRANFSDDAISRVTEAIRLAAVTVSSARPAQQRLQIDVQADRIGFVLAGETPGGHISDEAITGLLTDTEALGLTANADVDACAVTGHVANSS